MKRKGYLKILIILLCFADLVWVAAWISRIRHIRESSVQTYVDDRYTGDFKVVSVTGTMLDKTYVVCTEDENAITFEVRCWLGGCSTPWGSIAFIPQIHYSDNLAENLTASVFDDGTVIEWDGGSLDEVVLDMKEPYEKVENLYAKYDILWVKPSLKYEIRYNNQTVTVEYTGQADSILKDTLTAEFYSP
jgi:hypothetical protein